MNPGKSSVQHTAKSANKSGPMIDTLGIVGVGLIGGSFAAALRKAGGVKRVIAAGRRPQTLAQALELGLIDEAVSYADLAEQADVVFIGTPVGALPGVLEQLLPTLRTSSVLTDGGSTKQDVVATVRAVMKGRAAQFVPGHPMAGSHEMGPNAARADLYEQRRVMLTPLEENKRADVELVTRLWETCGAHITTLNPFEHDAALASVSHLPHWLAALYMLHVMQSDDPDLRLALAGPGFRDFSRIAQGSPEMWRDIFIANRDALLQDISAIRLMMDRAEAALIDKDAEFIERMLSEASDARRDWKEFRA
jgi:prephenate dehydrogenase